MTPSDLATLSLLDPDQGVCPAGHRCTLGATAGYRMCQTCDYGGLALICWDITSEAIESAEKAAAERAVVARAVEFLNDRGA